jgi:ABC-type Fe3+/spermidine/putrescine transport system ATPase subunit
MSMVIEVEGLTKRYGAHLAVDDVGLTVTEGEIFGILGVNGAGKTTTVECLQGVRRPDGGRMRVLDLDPRTAGSRLRALVGSQLQASALPDRLRVEEAVLLFGDVALPAGVGVADQPVEFDTASDPGGHVQGVDDQRGGNRARCLPPNDAAGEHVDHEGDVHDTGPRRAVGEVRHPLVVRPGGGEVTAQQVRCARRGGVRVGREAPLRAARAPDALGAHQPGDLVTADVQALQAALVSLRRPYTE